MWDGERVGLDVIASRHDRTFAALPGGPPLVLWEVAGPPAVTLDRRHARFGRGRSSS
jgi:hypothetical protein